MKKINLQNIQIVLAEPQYAGNIGAVARAMKNMGLSQLRIVNPKTEVLTEEAYQMACSAKNILKRAVIFPTLLEAVSEAKLVIGTTRREGLFREHVYTPRVVAEKAIGISQTNKVAIVFGNEVKGLKNRDIALCNWLVKIPTHPDFKSLNLAQAAMILCYELYQVNADFHPQPTLNYADSKEQESMYQQLKDALLKIGFLDKKNPERLMFAFRRVFGRAGLEERDVRILRGLSRQIAWYAGSKNEQ